MIGPLRLLVLVGLAGFVFARPKTRNVRGLALVAGTWALVFGIEAGGWVWSLDVESALVGLAAALAYFSPSWLDTHRTFAAEYSATDEAVRQAVMRAEREWRAGQIDDAAYSRAFDRAVVAYQALRPPSRAWRRIVEERVQIEQRWSALFAHPTAASQEEQDALAKAEASLRRRLAQMH